MKEDTKSLRFPEEADKKLAKLAERLGRSKREVFIEMVDYFDKAKKDPADVNDDLLKREVSQGINRIISFIKTQEKDTLSPMLAEVREGHRATLLVDKMQGNQWSRWIGNWNPYRKDFDQLVEAFNHFFYRDPSLKLRGYAVEQFASLHQEAANGRAETRKLVEMTQTTAKREKALKTAFAAVLGDYIGKREALNSITQGKAIKELQTQTLYQIQDL